MENTGVKKEPRAWNRYTGKRAQNVDWVRKYLRDGLEEKERRGHILNRESLTACKWLLLIEGIPVDRTAAQWLARREQQKNKRAAKPVGNVPKILKEFQFQ